MYFSILPNIEYDVKPKSFPFSSADFTVVKNFFRRFEINPDIFDHVAYFNKYAIPESVRIDHVARVLYGREDYDWIIALMNNITNVHEQWPLDSGTFQTWCEEKYGETCYSDVRYYEIEEDVKNSKNTVFLKKGQKVDKTFYEGNFSYNLQDANNTVQTVPGNSISRPVSVFEAENRINEEKRNIYILKANYIPAILQELKKQSNYNKCSAYVSKKLKKATI